MPTTATMSSLCPIPVPQSSSHLQTPRQPLLRPSFASSNPITPTPSSSQVPHKSAQQHGFSPNGVAFVGGKTGGKKRKQEVVSVEVYMWDDMVYNTSIVGMRRLRGMDFEKSRRSYQSVPALPY